MGKKEWINFAQYRKLRRLNRGIRKFEKLQRKVPLITSWQYTTQTPARQ